MPTTQNIDKILLAKAQQLTGLRGKRSSAEAVGEKLLTRDRRLKAAAESLELAMERVHHAA